MFQIAHEKYGHTDALARLVYFKLLRFGRLGAGRKLVSNADGKVHEEKSSSFEGQCHLGEGPSSSIQSLSHEPNSMTVSMPAPPQQCIPSDRRTQSSYDSTEASRSLPHEDSSSAPGKFESSSTRGHLAPSGASRQFNALPLQNPLGGGHDAAGRRNFIASSAHEAMPIETVKRGTLLALHKQETRGSRSMYVSAHLLLSTFYRYSKRGRLGRLGMKELASDLEFLPGLVTNAQLAMSFESAGSGSDLDYGGMLRCLKSCGEIAFGGSGGESDVDLMQRMRQKLADLLDDGDDCDDEMEGQRREGASEASHGTSRSSSADDSPHVGQGTHKLCPQGDATMLLSSEALSREEQVSGEEQAAMDGLASAWTQKQIALRSELESCAIAMEKSAADKLQFHREKREAEAAKVRPSSNIVKLRAQLKNMTNILTDEERQWMQREIRIKDGEERKKHTADLERKVRVGEGKILDELGKARLAFRDESRYLEQKLASEMEASFKQLRLRFDAKRRVASDKQKSSVRQVIVAHQAIEKSNGQNENGSLRKYSKVSAPAPESAEPSGAPLDRRLDNQNRVTTNCALRPVETPTKYAMMDLQAHLRLFFGNVFEAFVFLDVHNDHTVRRNELLRQLPLLYPGIKLDQVMYEIEGGDENKMTVMDVMDFAKKISWHSLGSLEDQRARYLQVLKHRRRIVERVHASLSESSGKDPSSRAVAQSKPSAYRPWSLLRTAVANSGAVNSKSKSNSDEFHEGLSSRLEAQGESSQSKHLSVLPGAVLGSVAGTKARTYLKPARSRPSSAPSNRRDIQVQLAGEGSELAQLEMETKMLANQVLDAETLLAYRIRSKEEKLTHQVAGPSRSFQTRESQSTKKISKIPEFVGPKGGYKDSDGLSSLIRSDDTQTVSKYVSRTGLWIAVPSTSRPSKRLPLHRAADRNGAAKIAGGLDSNDLRAPTEYCPNQDDIFRQQIDTGSAGNGGNFDRVASAGFSLVNAASPQRLPSGAPVNTGKVGGPSSTCATSTSQFVKVAKSEQEMAKWVGENAYLVRERLLGSPGGSAASLYCSDSSDTAFHSDSHGSPDKWDVVASLGSMQPGEKVAAVSSDGHPSANRTKFLGQSSPDSATAVKGLLDTSVNSPNLNQKSQSMNPEALIPDSQKQAHWDISISHDNSTEWEYACKFEAYRSLLISRHVSQTN